MVPQEGQWRIGELSRRTGVSEYLLRAWERRYQLLEPSRTQGGFRLYGPADERRVALMKGYLGNGMQAAEAAAAALDSSRAAHAAGNTDVAQLEDVARRLATALESYDESGAQAALDDLLASSSLETSLREVVLPYLHDLGRRWGEGSVSVSQEHFASHVLRARLAALSRGWGSGSGSPLLLACPSGEEHDLPLLCFGVVAHRRGRAIRYLGQNTPVSALAATADEIVPELIVLAATTPQPFRREQAGLRRLAQRHPLSLAGAGSSRRLAESIGARHLDSDPVTAVEAL